jgi:hypothetical protein
MPVNRPVPDAGPVPQIGTSFQTPADPARAWNAITDPNAVARRLTHEGCWTGYLDDLRHPLAGA